MSFNKRNYFVYGFPIELMRQVLFSMLKFISILPIMLLTVAGGMQVNVTFVNMCI